VLRYAASLSQRIARIAAGLGKQTGGRMTDVTLGREKSSQPWWSGSVHVGPWKTDISDHSNQRPLAEPPTTEPALSAQRDLTPHTADVILPAQPFADTAK
jgi:hypothetical protein